ncbi:MAG: sensor histidine kinase [Bacteroidetes bacterium]|nr:MAG: sensor histidine kinase [Bacteroidota bacterium]
MRLLLLIFLFPVFAWAQPRLDSILSVPYDAMVADLPASLALLQEGMALATQQLDTLSTAQLHAKLGTVTFLMGDHEKSLEHTIAAIGLYERLGMYAKAGGLYCGLGYQIKRRDLEKGIGYMRQGLAILQQHPDSSELEPGYSNFGVLKEMKGELDSATFYYNRAYAIALARKDSVAIPYSLHHLGGVALMQKKYTEAKRLFDQGLLIRALRNDRNGMAESHIFLGEYFKELQQVDSATVHFNEAVSLSLELGNRYMRQYCYEQLAQLYEAAGSATEAVRYYKLYNAVKDTLLDMQRTEQLAEMETRFETAKLRQAKAEQELRISQQRNWIVGLAAAAVLVMLLSLLIFQQMRRREAERRNAAIIAEREQGLRAIIQATEDERKRIAKDLHDGIVQSLTGLSLRMQKQANSTEAKRAGLDEELNSTRTVLDESIAEVRGISHQMMPRVLSEMGLLPALEDMLQKSLGHTDISYEFEHHNIRESRFTDSIEISLYRICQELINNIIKHSDAKAVSVQLLKTKSHLVLVVEDNGKGFEWNDPRTRNGIGLMNISSRAKAIHGEVNYEPSPQQGTVATIRVPLS